MIKSINDIITADKVNTLLEKYKHEMNTTNYDPSPITDSVCNLELFRELMVIIYQLSFGRGTVALSAMFVLGMQMGYNLAESEAMEAEFGDTN